ncbi:hypothetical protein JCGZ_08299 [Jatropha curcas]|uniref:Dehydrin n=1 Tax=Jatropha curcas TaxID=180498 RepID=E7BXD9_JATCU|nr:dehydrin Rab18-like [Jatropha curcas]ADT65201.1 dehydrin [Jatropha curcas]AHX74041.1 dehydrin 2 [Jatropha curcas]KDP37458.1 hypothetical protein JCGZ_08299 [Jatropha curcas]
MAHFQNQYGAVNYTDEYGNPVDEYGRAIRQTDEYGNPIPQTGTTTAYGGAPETGTTGLGMGHRQEHYGESGQLHRSGSSSSSSSEDDGHGGRRKKGLKEKIKEKLPGHHKEERTQATSATTPGGYHSAEYGHDHEKKGIMDKIKEKLPGSHHHEHH